MPYKGLSFQFQIGLEDYFNPGNLKTNPTIAAGDFQISIDGGAYANLNTLPAAAPAGSASVTIVVSNTEAAVTNFLTIKGVDQTVPPEWSAYLRSFTLEDAYKSNVIQVTSLPLAGVGTAGDPWRPA